jgi:predicted amidohydrolase
VFRYPEIPRALALAGAQIVFAPHYVTTRSGALPAGWLDPTGPYNEKALMCRAIENTVYVAAANPAMPNQGSASCIIGPDGRLLARVPYGDVGVVTADLDLDLATGLIAKRWSPERSTRSP